MTDQPSAKSIPAPAARRQHLFVVRMWWEPDGGDMVGEWRGSIEHVNSRTKRYFRDMEKLAVFIEDHLTPTVSGRTEAEGEQARSRGNERNE
jgi:hypothetical protein